MFFAWFMYLSWVPGDIFRSSDLGGGGGSEQLTIREPELQHPVADPIADVRSSRRG